MNPPCPSTPLLLDVQDLSVELATPHGRALAVRGLDLQLAPGDTLGLVGESGCGKSLTALALMGLLPDSARVSGRLVFAGEDLLAWPEARWCTLRGNRVAMVFQEPMTALNPLHTVGDQVAEPLRRHQGLPRREALRQALALLDRVGISQAAQRMSAYPHQFSGGQRQRITIAMALANHPALLIADEPTTALDVTVAEQILGLIAELVRERQMALVLISHDLAVIAQQVQQVMVMYGGTVVEAGPTPQVFARPSHPYTRGLLASRPHFGMQPPAPGRARPRLPTIPGTVPELHRLGSGCAFAPRCTLASPACGHAPGWTAPGTGPSAPGTHRLRCFHPPASA